MRIAGVDPGKRGALVVVSCDSDEGGYFRLRYNKAGHLIDDDLLGFLETAAPDQIVLEKVQGRGRGVGATQTFNFGFCCGELNALLRYWASLRKVAMHYVNPQAWQKEFHAGMPASLSAKEKSMLAYDRLFPHHPGRISSARTTDDNVVDALLLATFGVLRFGHGGLKRWNLTRCVADAEPSETGGKTNVLPLSRRRPDHDRE